MNNDTSDDTSNNIIEPSQNNLPKQYGKYSGSKSMSSVNCGREKTYY